MNPTIYLIQLMSGQWLLSEATFNGNNVYLTNPHFLMLVEDKESGQRRTVLHPYLPFKEVTTFWVEKDKFMGHIQLDEGDIVDMYNRVLSPIDLPPPPKIITGE